MENQIPVAEAAEGAVPMFQQSRAYTEMMKLFEEMSFMQKMKAMFNGLNFPKDSGEYKFARLQLQLMAGPILAVLVPLCVIGILLTIKAAPPSDKIVVTTEIVEADAPPDIEEPPPPPPETVQFERVDTDFDGPSANPFVSDFAGPVTSEPLSPKPAAISTVSLNKSPITFKNMIGSRDPGQRGAAITGGGGSQGGEATVLRSLRWLKSKQLENGSWTGSSGSNVSNTGLALLCFLAHGEIPGDTCPEFGETVEKGIRWLVAAQDQNGLFSPGDGHRYNHLIATYALAEAYTLTSTPMLKEVVEKAGGRIVRGQRPDGTWDYNMNPESARKDSSYSAWAAQALKACYMAYETVGLDIPGLDAAYKKAATGFKEFAAQSGGFGYDGRGRSGLTGAGVLCMQLLGAGRDPDVSASLSFLSTAKFSFDKWDIEQPYGPQGSPIYYWYYITQAKFHAGGATWNEWNKMFAGELVKNQQIIQADDADAESRSHNIYGTIVGKRNIIQDHNNRWRDIGYWDSPSEAEHDGYDGGQSYAGGPEGPNRWSKGIKATQSTTTDGKRIQITALCALQLMVYYRYLPSYKPVEADTREVRSGDKDGEIIIDIFGDYQSPLFEQIDDVIYASR